MADSEYEYVLLDWARDLPGPELFERFCADLRRKLNESPRHIEGIRVPALAWYKLQTETVNRAHALGMHAPMCHHDSPNRHFLLMGVEIIPEAA